MRGVEFELENQLDDKHQIFINEKAFTEAVTNLICNAMEAATSHECPRVLVKLSHDESFIQLGVCDNGNGVAPELADELFDPFVSGKSQGTGLGLAVVQSVVHSAGGRVYWERCAEQTHFVVSIPFVHDLQAPEAEIQTLDESRRAKAATEDPQR